MFEGAANTWGKSNHFGMHCFWLWYAYALWTSLVCCYVPLFALPGVVDATGRWFLGELTH
jgi:hypothetical protein